MDRFQMDQAKSVIDKKVSSSKNFQQYLGLLSREDFLWNGKNEWFAKILWGKQST